MKFIIRATSGDLAKDYEETLKPFDYQIEEREGWRGMKYDVATVQVKTLEELIKLQKALKKSIIIEKGEKDFAIEIYDTYRE